MRQLLALLLRLSGLPTLVRETICRRRVTIIVYHDPAPEVFEAHLAYLVDRFNVVPLDQLVGAIEQSDRDRVLPKSMCITFDDGYPGNHALVDLIRTYQLPITIYLDAEAVDTRVDHGRAGSGVQPQPLGPPSTQPHLEPEDRGSGNQARRESTERHPFSETQIREMKLHQVSFQGHTLRHANLPACSDRERWLEIAESKQVLEGLLGEPVEHFAYPYGSYDKKDIAYVQEAGYRSARTLDAGWNGLGTNVFALKGMVISDDATLSEMIAQLCGVFPYFRYLRRGSLTGKQTRI